MNHKDAGNSFIISYYHSPNGIIVNQEGTSNFDVPTDVPRTYLTIGNSMEITVVRAYVRQRLDKTGQPWVGTVEYITSDDPDKRKSSSRTFDLSKETDREKAKEKAKRQLKKFRDEVVGELAAKPAPAPKRPDADNTVADYVTRITGERIAAEKLQCSTAYGYKFSLAHIRDGFQTITVRDLKSSDVTKWIARMNDAGLSPATISKSFRLLKQALDQAVDDEIIDRNPCAKKSVKLPTARKEKPNVLDAKGRTALVDALSRMERTPTVLAAYIAMLTGARRGEICALRWADIDLDKALVHVRRSIGIREGGCYVKDTKSENGTRVIPISTQLMPIIAAHRAFMYSDWSELMDTMEIKHDEADFGSLYVLGTLDGRYANPTRLGKQWQALAESLNLVGSQGRTITLHDLRHCVATVSVAEGADPKSIASNLGHADVRLTLDVYAADDLDAKRRAAELVGAAYFPNQ